MRSNNKSESIIAVDKVHRLKKVREFTSVANDWVSGYSMDEKVEIVLVLPDGESRIEVKTRAKKYNNKKNRTEIKRCLMMMLIT